VQPHESAPVRLAHFSDVHVTTRSLWRLRDWSSKRLSGWVNLRLLGRGYRFRNTDGVLLALADDLRQRGFDRVLFSGDATALGAPEEVTRAADLLGAASLPGLAVPGNHDYCCAGDARSGWFERCFAPWQQGERVGGHAYPFAQRVGPLWVVGVCSATPNLLPVDARGAVGAAQLDRLAALLGRLAPGPRVLVTHYPVARPNGRPEHRLRLLRDLDALVAVAARGGVVLWLHGHRHDAYHHPAGRVAPFPVVCAGSATQTGLWSYGDYTVAGGRLHARRRVFLTAEKRFGDGPAFELGLFCPQPAGAL
jgi:3',5'-cyclic AMP phosphodiesterase CpdA